VSNEKDTIYFLSWALDYVREKMPKRESSTDTLIILKLAERHLKELINESSGTNREDRDA
jgi:hypothetical protein